MPSDLLRQHRNVAKGVLDIQVLGPDSCSTLLSSIEIIRGFEKGAGYDEARAPVHAKDNHKQKGPAELPAFSVKGGSFLGRLVETSHAARHLRLDRRCHTSSHFSR
jgi:hypothetical protein